MRSVALPIFGRAFVFPGGERLCQSMKKSRLFSLVLVAVMTALATVIYMLFPEIPLVPGVEYLKVDFSDIPALVTTFTVGPVYGVSVEIFKNVIHLFRTSTFGIGEVMNSGIGAAMLLSMWGGCRLFGRLFKKDAYSAAPYYASAVVTVLVTILAGWALSAALTPLFYRMMHWPLTTAALMAGVWGSTLLNAIKCAITVLPFWPLIKVVRLSAKNYI